MRFEQSGRAACHRRLLKQNRECRFHAIPSQRFRHIQSAVSRFQQFRKFAVYLRNLCRAANAHRYDFMWIAGMRNAKLFNREANLFSNRDGPLTVCIRQNHRELLASIARHQIGRTLQHLDCGLSDLA